MAKRKTLEESNDLKVIMYPVDKIRPYGNNPRRNEGAVEWVAKSIQEYGWTQPIVIDRDGVIIAGHTRFEAAKRLGLQEVPVNIADDLDEQRARAYRIADNRIHEKSRFNDRLLAVEMKALPDDALTGFTEDEKEDIFARFEDGEDAAGEGEDGEDAAGEGEDGEDAAGEGEEIPYLIVFDTLEDRKKFQSYVKRFNGDMDAMIRDMSESLSKEQQEKD